METTPDKPRRAPLPKRERPKPVRLTDAAAARIVEIMANAEGKYLGVRVGVTNGGCAGMSYVMDYAEAAKPFEEVMEEKGVKIFIGAENKLFSLSGSSMIAAPLRGGDRRVAGVLGVIGPTRLNYGRIVPMVEYAAQVLGELKRSR